MRGVPLKYSVRNLWRRPARTMLTVLGLSLLVALIVFLTAFGRSFGRALRLPGDPQNLIVLSKKAQTFELSSIPASELDAMESNVADEIEAGPDGDPLFSKEVYHFVVVRFPDDPDISPRRGLVHGIRPEHTGLLTGFKLIDGSLPEPNMNEIVIGKSVASRLRVPPEKVATGAAVMLRDTVFEIVGTFEAPGTLYENWLITHPNDLRVTLGRRDYSFGRMKVREGVDMAALAKRLSTDERYQVMVLPEVAYFADFAEGFSHFTRFSVVLAIILGVGGILTGMNTMHNAVVGRTREIGMLRVLGFGRGKVLLAFAVEALLLCGMAGIVGCVFGLFTNGLPIRVPIAASFPVVVDGVAILTGFAAALLMGILGLSFPIARALRLPPVEAVRAV